jgi:hypothetical protein
MQQFHLFAIGPDLHLHPVKVDDSGLVQTSATLDGSDIQLGAVEVKDGASDNRLSVSAVGAALVEPVQVSTWTNRSGTIATGGASQTLAAANSSRKYLFIQNISVENLWFNETTAAAADAASIRLAPGDSYESPAQAVPRGLITIIGATTGSKFVAKEG